MKHVFGTLAALILISSMGFAQMRGGSCDGTGPYGSGSQGNMNHSGAMGGGNGTMAGSGLYDLSTITTVTGTIVDFYSAAEDAIAPHHPVLSLADGTTVTVITAPSWFLDAQSFLMEIGDVITVTGSLVEQDSGTVLIAAEITKGDVTLVLRDDLGYPLWQAAHQSHDGYRNPGTYPNIAYDPSLETTVNGSVSQVLVGSLTPGTYPGYQLVVTLTDGTDLAVQLAPYWYLLNQGFSLETGVEVTLTGVFVTLEDGSEIFLVRTLTAGDLELVLRDENGIPLWIGIRGHMGGN